MATKSNLPRPPAHLSASARKWFSETVSGFELEPHHLRLLIAACESLDRADEARETLKREGTYYRTKRGEPRPHPAVRVERDARVTFARLVRELGLDATTTPEPPRAPKGAPPSRVI